MGLKPHKGENMEKFNSVLTLRQLVFDKIRFDRKGFKNENEVKFSIKVQIGKDDCQNYRVTLILGGEKEDEYELEISLSGFFSIDEKNSLDDNTTRDLINKNAVSILMPYLRSELTLLTAQPGTESLVLPPFNINKMLKDD